MDSKPSLDGVIGQESKLEKLGNRALSELKLLPYEALGALAGGYGGSKLGKLVSQKFPVSSDSFFLNLGQDLQNNVAAFVGGIVIVIPVTYATRMIGKYVNKKIKDLS